MIIVLEGADGSGKSTLGKRLEADGIGRYIHSARPLSGQELRENMAKLIYWSTVLKTPVICDRAGWISEQVYSTAMDRPQMVPNNELHRLMDLPQIYVYCTADEYHIVEGKEHKPPEYMERLYHNHTRIRGAYASLFTAMIASMRYKIFLFNYQRHDYETLKRGLIECVASF